MLRNRPIARWLLGVCALLARGATAQDAELDLTPFVLLRDDASAGSAVVRTSWPASWGTWPSRPARRNTRFGAKSRHSRTQGHSIPLSPATTGLVPVGP